MSFNTWFKTTKAIMPVIVIDDLEDAVPLAQALMAGGIHCLEVTLRTEQGLAAIEKISQACPDAIVGAGTVINGQQMRAAHKAGAQFIISPGISAELCETANELTLPYAPGVMTPSDIILGLEYGIDLFKLFPADIAGGPAMLKALSGPFPNVQFCPTGGVSPRNMQEYISLNNVSAIGGSWVCPKELVVKKDWPAITKLAAAI